MQLQRCVFRRKKNSVCEAGIAIVNGWDSNDVSTILDINLNKVKGDVWDYQLVRGGPEQHNVYLYIPD